MRRLRRADPEEAPGRASGRPYMHRVPVRARQASGPLHDQPPRQQGQSASVKRAQGARGGWGGTLAIAAALLALAVVVLWFTVTSSHPLLPLPPAPTANQVGAGRDAYRQLRDARGTRTGTPL